MFFGSGCIVLLSWLLGLRKTNLRSILSCFMLVLDRHRIHTHLGYDADVKTIPALAIQFLAGNPPKLPPERCVTGSGALRLVGSQNHHEITTHAATCA